jgi:hypothetical protein
LENLTVKYNLGKPTHRNIDNIKYILKKQEKVWTGFIWLKIGTRNGEGCNATSASIKWVGI